MSGYTKGPWTYEDDRFGLLIRGADRTEIAAVTKWYGSEAKERAEYAANSKLLAAAPDLLEALQACSKELRAMIDRYNERSPFDGSFLYDHQTVFEADCAIAKALA